MFIVEISSVNLEYQTRSDKEWGKVNCQAPADLNSQPTALRALCF